MPAFALGGFHRFVLSAGAPGYGQPPRRHRMGSLLTLAASVGAPLMLGQVVGIWTIPDVIDWFPRLRKPSWTPPRWAFPPIWASLYAAMGVAAHRVWLAGGGPLPLGLYGLQLVLNLAWQPLVRFQPCLSGALGIALQLRHVLHRPPPPPAARPLVQFFKAHDLKAASYDITALLGVLAVTLWQFAKYDALAAKLMVPYIAFSAFAAALTYDIRAKNGDKVE